MTTSLLTTDTTAPVRLRDRARAALREALPASGTAEMAAAIRAQGAARSAERSRRRAVALQFGAYPAGRSAASVLLPGGPGA